MCATVCVYIILNIYIYINKHNNALLIFNIPNTVIHVLAKLTYILTANDGSSFRFRGEITSNIISLPCFISQGILITTLAIYRMLPYSSSNVEGKLSGREKLNG